MGGSSCIISPPLSFTAQLDVFTLLFCTQGGGGGWWWVGGLYFVLLPTQFNSVCFWCRSCCVVRRLQGLWFKLTCLHTLNASSTPSAWERVQVCDSKSKDLPTLKRFDMFVLKESFSHLEVDFNGHSDINLQHLYNYGNWNRPYVWHVLKLLHAINQSFYLAWS